MAASVIKQRTIEKFIMSEFVQGNLNTKEQVSCMLILIQKKLGMSVEQASDSHGQYNTISRSRFQSDKLNIRQTNINRWIHVFTLRRFHT